MAWLVAYHCQSDYTFAGYAHDYERARELAVDLLDSSAIVRMSELLMDWEPPDWTVLDVCGPSRTANGHIHLVAEGQRRGPRPDGLEPLPTFALRTVVTSYLGAHVDAITAGLLDAESS